MDKIVLAYCAGVIDSDGCITLVTYASAQNVGFTLRVAVHQANREAIDLLAETFGGKPWTSKNPKYFSRRTGKPQYTWERSAKKGAEVLRALLPYLRIKRQQAILGLRFQEMLHEKARWQPVMVTVRPEGRKSYRCRRYRLKDTSRRATQKLALQIRALNDSRAPHQKRFQGWHDQELQLVPPLDNS